MSPADQQTGDRMGIVFQDHGPAPPSLRGRQAPPDCSSRRGLRSARNALASKYSTDRKLASPQMEGAPISVTALHTHELLPGASVERAPSQRNDSSGPKTLHSRSDRNRAGFDSRSKRDKPASEWVT